MGGRIGSGGRKVHSRSFYFRFRRHTASVAYIGTSNGVRAPHDPRQVLEVIRRQNHQNNTTSGYCTNWCTYRHMHQTAPNVLKLTRDDI